MTDNKPAPGDLPAAQFVSLESAGMRSSEAELAEAPEPQPEKLADENPPQPFKSKRIDLTAEYEGMNIGYMGGVRVPGKKSNASD